MIKLKVFALLFVLALASLACADGSSNAHEPTGEDTDDVVGRDPSQPRSQTTSLVLLNGYSRQSIGVVNLSPSSQRSWGPDQLDGTLQPGGIFTLDGIRCGDYYDLRLLGPTGVTLEIEQEIYFPCTSPVEYITFDG